MAMLIFLSKTNVLFLPLTKVFHAYTKFQVEHMRAHVHKFISLPL